MSLAFDHSLALDPSLEPEQPPGLEQLPAPEHGQRARQTVGRSVDAGRRAAERGQQAARRYIDNAQNRPVIAGALRIRAVETALYDLFGKGRLHGTIHTCIGQEFTGAVLGKFLQPGDFVTSNHRCHGHFIGATGNWAGLIDELVGNGEGVCAGIGSSQHLWAPNFLSNGQQGGLLPVAAGIALDRKLRESGSVAVSFIGEGTLGEGVVYETLNLDALWGLPHIVICENNFYSQSTMQERSVAGEIAARAAAFGVTAASADTWDLPGFEAVLEQAIARARLRAQPSFITLATYRLNPHSKGDDLRDRSEIDWFGAHDPLALAMAAKPEYQALYETYLAEAQVHITAALDKPAHDAASYFVDQLPHVPPSATVAWHELPAADERPRIAQQLNSFYDAKLRADTAACFLGEDIEDPYGGAFKVAKGLTTAYAPRVRTTPISEAAITGVGIGLAVCGRRTFVEIMFGDFITYAFDQIVNNAAKMFHMYARHVECPVVIRTPMGGRRGYGPTHSQSLERLLIGIENTCVISLNSLAEVSLQLAGLETLRGPLILLENKSDYTARVFAPPAGLAVVSDQATLPTFAVRPEQAKPTVTLLAYGGMARFVADLLLEIFERTDAVPELIVPTSLFPLNLAPLRHSLAQTRRLVIIEEGAGFGSLGAEAIAQLSEQAAGFAVARVSGKSAPVPSAPALERATLPGLDEICQAVFSVMSRAP